MAHQPTGTSKRVVRVEIALSLVDKLCYIVFGLVLARPSENKLIWFSDAVLLFAVEWRKNLHLSSCLFLNLQVRVKRLLRW